MSTKLTLEERFHTQYQPVTESGCWIWVGSKTSRGYGSIKDYYKTRSAHRVSYELHKGIIPKGKMICHTCDIKSCVNPAHLYVGTAYDNMRDVKERGNKNIPRGMDHPNAKLTDGQVIEIRTSVLTGVELARKFNVCPATISEIRNYKKRAIVKEQKE